eukprot:scaffold126374_cov63-Attheya_sp.AAC.3
MDLEQTFTTGFLPSIRCQDCPSIPRAEITGCNRKNGVSFCHVVLCRGIRCLLGPILDLFMCRVQDYIGQATSRGSTY